MNSTSVAVRSEEEIGFRSTGGTALAPSLDTPERETREPCGISLLTGANVGDVGIQAITARQPKPDAAWSANGRQSMQYDACGEPGILQVPDR